MILALAGDRRRPRSAKLNDSAEEFAADHDDQIDGGLDKAEGLAKKKVSGHDEQIDLDFEKIKGFIPKGE